ELQATDLDEGLFSTYDILHLEGYLVANKSLFEKALQYAKAYQMTVSLDLASYNVVAAYLPFLKQVIQDSVDIVFANEEEAKALTGKSPVEALDEIAQMCDTAIVKVGMNGSFIKHN